MVPSVDAPCAHLRIRLHDRVRDTVDAGTSRSGEVYGFALLPSGNPERSQKRLAVAALRSPSLRGPSAPVAHEALPAIHGSLRVLQPSADPALGEG